MWAVVFSFDNLELSVWPVARCIVAVVVVVVVVVFCSAARETERGCVFVHDRMKDWKPLALCKHGFVHHGRLPPASSAMLMIHMLMSIPPSYWPLLKQV